ncbi:ABC transporter substrate-binding protein [Nocardioides anomalus]|uniref:ABC transporter substrate-binding protein n=1 Tax=Nocardioides anomalus TaxID=2712223 RepID=UPI0018AD3F77|nr:ABC transporter substrate-binding protein [Nocardioides anomalus]
MSSPRHTGSGRLLGLVALVVSAALALTAAPGLAQAAAPTSDRGARSSTVAHTDQGTMTSRVVGRTADGQKVTGSFTPLRVVTKQGQPAVKGLLQGVVKEGGGRTSTFSSLQTIPIKKIAGQPVDAKSAGAAVSSRAGCDILNLVLGPLDLDLLGLQVHLKQVVLDIVAVTGAGNLLGNLLCAVTGLLDGGPLAGLLGQLTTLLNQILAALRLGA